MKNQEIKKERCILENDNFKLIYKGDISKVNVSEIMEMVAVLFLTVHADKYDKFGKDAAMDLANSAAFNLVEIVKDYIKDNPKEGEQDERKD